VIRNATARCLRVTVSGHVQGVCFRHYARQKAIELGICGWVKNTADGSVEALICGSATALDAMLAWLSHGPPSAEAHHTDARPWQGPPPDSGFRIVY